MTVIRIEFLSKRVIPPKSTCAEQWHIAHSSNLLIYIRILRHPVTGIGDRQ